MRRTKVLLHQAMASLMHEKSWDDIVVKEILARADVGRSTFYAHFRDKNALLLSALRDTLRTTHVPEASDATERVLAFSLPLLEHIERVRTAGHASLNSHDYASLHARLRPALVVVIEESLREIPRSRDRGGSALPHELLADYLASTFLLTLEWWIGQPTTTSARRADDVFRSLVRPALQTP